MVLGKRFTVVPQHDAGKFAVVQYFDCVSSTTVAIVTGEFFATQICAMLNGELANYPTVDAYMAVCRANDSNRESAAASARDVVRLSKTLADAVRERDAARAAERHACSAVKYLQIDIKALHDQCDIYKGQLKQARDEVNTLKEAASLPLEGQHHTPDRNAHNAVDREVLLAFARHINRALGLL